MSKTRIAAVKYLNTLPMLAGLQDAEVARELDIKLEAPARCAELLLNGDVDVALCPIGALLGQENFHIASRYGIGCKGAVRTVALYSDRPLAELKAVRLFSESRTSNLLVQVLDAFYWKYGLEFISEEQSVAVPTADLVIGDACFERESKYAHVTDLGEAWHNFTGLPFLFAAWVSLKPVDSALWAKVDSSFASGIESVDSMEIPGSQAHVHLRPYLQENIRYEVDEAALAGMRKFIELVSKLPSNHQNAAQAPSGQSI